MPSVDEEKTGVERDALGERGTKYSFLSIWKGLHVYYLERHGRMDGSAGGVPESGVWSGARPQRLFRGAFDPALHAQIAHVAAVHVIEETQTFA